MNLPAKELIEILKPAYKPCESFGECPEAQWSPENGHIPRGYLGATGKISEVEVVFVVAEPSHPLETYPKIADPLTYITASTDLAYECYAFNTYQGGIPLKSTVGHANLKYFLNRLYPELTFDKQLKKIWITESRLCSIDEKIGNIKSDKRTICSRNYLQKQLELLSHAEIVGFGGKAQQMLNKLKIGYHKANALYPPEGNKPRAKESWDRIMKRIKNENTNYPEKKDQVGSPTREISLPTIEPIKKILIEQKTTMDKNFKDLEEEVDGKILTTRNFSRPKLTPEETEIIKQSAKNINFKEILNRHTLRDITHKRGDPQTVITEYAKALGFSFPARNKSSYLAVTRKIMGSFYDQHCHDEQIIIMNNNLGIQDCLPSIFSIADYFMVVWVADFRLEGIGKLYSELREITKEYKFNA